MLYLEKEVFELISPMVYYLRVVSRATPHQLSVSLFFESGAVSTIGFVCLAILVLSWTVFQRFEFLNGQCGYQISEGGLNYFTISEYIYLRRVRYSVLYSSNTTCLLIKWSKNA